MGNPMFVDMANSMGANGVPLGYDQVFSSLQTGVVDGAENNPPSFVFDNHYQVAKFYTIDEHLIVPEMLVMSKKIYDSLSKEEQADVKKFAREAQLEERKLWDDLSAEGDGQGEGRRHPDHPGLGRREEKVPGGGEAGVGQIRPQIRRHDQAHPGGEVTTQTLAPRLSVSRSSANGEAWRALFCRRLIPRAADAGGH